MSKKRKEMFKTRTRLKQLNHDHQQKIFLILN